MWQPVSQVGVLLAHVAEQLADTREMHRMLAAGRPRRPGAVPEHVLDDDTVGRTLAVYGRMADYRELFAEAGGPVRAAGPARVCPAEPVLAAGVVRYRGGLRPRRVRAGRGDPGRRLGSASGVILVDTGPIVAAALTRDMHHRACVDLFTAAHLTAGDVLAVASPVVTEACYLLAREGWCPGARPRC